MVGIALNRAEFATIQKLNSLPRLDQTQVGSIDAKLVADAVRNAGVALQIITEDDAVRQFSGANPLPDRAYVPFPGLLDSLSGLDLSRMQIALLSYFGLTPKSQPDVSGIIDPAEFLNHLGVIDRIYTFSTSVLNAVSDNLGVFNVGGGATSLSVGTADADGPVGFIYTVSQADVNLPSRNIDLQLFDPATASVLATWNFNLPDVLANGGIFVWAPAEATRRVATVNVAANAPLGPFPANSNITETYTDTATPNVYRVGTNPTGLQYIFSGVNLNVDIIPVDYSRETIYALNACLVTRRMDLFPLWALSKFGRVAF